MSENLAYPALPTSRDRSAVKPAARCASPRTRDGHNSVLLEPTLPFMTCSPASSTQMSQQSAPVSHKGVSQQPTLQRHRSRDKADKTCAEWAVSRKTRPITGLTGVVHVGQPGGVCVVGYRSADSPAPVPRHGRPLLPRGVPSAAGQGGPRTSIVAAMSQGRVMGHSSSVLAAAFVGRVAGHGAATGRVAAGARLVPPGSAASRRRRGACGGRRRTRRRGRRAP